MYRAMKMSQRAKMIALAVCLLFVFGLSILVNFGVKASARGWLFSQPQPVQAAAKSTELEWRVYFESGEEGVQEKVSEANSLPQDLHQTGIGDRLADAPPGHCFSYDTAARTDEAVTCILRSRTALF